jgi:hypothetical protein
MFVNRFRVGAPLLVAVVAYTAGFVEYAHDRLEHHAQDPVTLHHSCVTTASQRTSVAMGDDCSYAKTASPPYTPKPGTPSSPSRDSHQNCPVCQTLAVIKVFPLPASPAPLPDVLPMGTVVLHDPARSPTHPALWHLARAPPAYFQPSASL